MIQAQVRPARHRRADARGLHDGDARGDARCRRAARAATGARRWSGSPRSRAAPTARVVYDDPRFLDVLPRRDAGARAATRATSAAARRAAAAGGGVESLRAIPWLFAWTQTRLLLPSWLGAGEALGDALARGEARAAARRCTRDWPFFRSTLDLIEMVLAEGRRRGSPRSTTARLVPAELQPLGADLRARLGEPVAAVLDVTGHAASCSSDNAVLRRSIDVRNPYVDPINLVQIELLRAPASSAGRRPGGAASARSLVTVNGIAAGMRNTG